MRQQVFQSGYAPEQLSGVGQQAGGSLQQAAFATALPQGQQYQPSVPFNTWTWHQLAQHQHGGGRDTCSGQVAVQA
jgi:hypothetical protein